MKDKWEEGISCATACPRCDKALTPKDLRILSVYDHQPICMACKKKEEERPDYAQVSKEMLGQCIADVDQQWTDPESYCYYHFYPYKC
jgi:hypothetical protein